MRYLITIPAPARRTSPTTWAGESAFVQHLRELKDALAGRFSEIVVAMATMNDADWEQHKHALLTIDEAEEGIYFEELHEYGCSKLAFARQTPRLLFKIQRIVRESDFVHSHFVYDIYRPIGAWFCLFARAMRKPVVAIEDIDRRQDAEMNYKLGVWPKHTYLICKYVYDPARDLLMKAYVRHVDMVLFKEKQLVDDYGKGDGHVRLFLDPNFAAEHVIDDAFLEQKLRALDDPDRPLKLLYFGRLVPYKGVDKMLEAVASAHLRGANLTFDIMGGGEQHDALRALAQQLGIGHLVSWVAPRPYGPGFFEVLRERDLLLACPLSGDTPRSAWDALASGMPIVAFDTPFYKSMETLSHALELTPWPEVAPFADRLLAFARDKSQLKTKVTNAVQAARANTGESWLRRRVEWVDELVTKRRHAVTPLAIAAGYFAHIRDWL
jgi:glycosyltransferase involved in cell wall biosynthesis